MKLFTLATWILLSQLLIAVEARFIGPENTAVTKGGTAVLTCSSHNNNLRWSTRRKGPGVEELITRGGVVLPQYTHEYNVTRDGSRQLNLVIISAKFNDSGRYICLESSTSDSASAELIVVDQPALTCNHLSKNSADSPVTCEVEYSGSFIPDVDIHLKDLQQVSDNDSNPTKKRTVSLNVSFVSLSAIYYACTVRIRKDNTKTFIGENVNGVVGTAANNVPSYLNTKYLDANSTECKKKLCELHESQCKSGVHVCEPSQAANNHFSAVMLITPCLIILSFVPNIY